MFQELKFRPLIFLPKKELYYTLNDELDLIDISDKEFRDEFIRKQNQCISINGIGFIEYDNVYDLCFLRFLLTTTNRKDIFQNELYIIEDINEYCSNIEVPNLQQVKKHLIFLYKCFYNNMIISILERYKEYYNTIIKKIIQNTQHFNNQKIYINAFNFKKQIFYNDCRNLIKFEEKKSYIPIEIDHYNWTNTGRINSSLYSLVPQLEDNNCLVSQFPKGRIIQVDCHAAEWNLLLHYTGESSLHIIDKKAYWSQLTSIFGLNVDNKTMKGLLYMKIFGATKNTIVATLKITSEQYNVFIQSFKSKFPRTYSFCFDSNDKTRNQYISENSSILYDFYNKEIYIDSNYKKNSGLLQSSLSTKFQLYVSDVINKFQEYKLSSKLFLTIHDSIYIDVNNSEFATIKSILRECNNDNQLLLRIKKKES